MRARTLVVAPLAALLVLGPLAACSSGAEQQVCAVLEADGDDYIPIRDPASCPPPGAATAAEGPLWVPVSWLDDDDDHYRTHRTTRPSPTTKTPKTTTPKTMRTTTKSSSR